MKHYQYFFKTESGETKLAWGVAKSETALRSSLANLDIHGISRGRAATHKKALA